MLPEAFLKALEEVEFHRIFLIFNHLMKIKKTLFEQSHPVFDLPSRKLITSSAVKFSTV